MSTYSAINVFTVELYREISKLISISDKKVRLGGAQDVASGSGDGESSQVSSQSKQQVRSSLVLFLRVCKSRHEMRTQKSSLLCQANAGHAFWIQENWGKALYHCKQSKLQAFFRRHPRKSFPDPPSSEVSWHTYTPYNCAYNAKTYNLVIGFYSMLTCNDAKVKLLKSQLMLTYLQKKKWFVSVSTSHKRCNWAGLSLQVYFVTSSQHVSWFIIMCTLCLSWVGTLCTIITIHNGFCLHFLLHLVSLAEKKPILSWFKFFNL